MRVPSMFGAVGPFIATIAFVAIAAFLVFAIYFTLLELQWIAFLTGTLFASMLAMVSRATRAELAAVDSGAKFAVAQDRLSSETKARQHLESRLEYATRRLRYSDDIFPVMVAYHDAQGIFRYHNHAFRRWVDLPEHHIDGHHLREVLGKAAYAEMEPAVARVIAGEAVRYERTQKMANGAQVRLSVQLLPASDGHEYGDGFFAIISDITPNGASGSSNSSSKELASISSRTSQLHFDTSVAEAATGLLNVRERMLSALERDEFALYRQTITPLNHAAGLHRHYEVLIRLIEEENHLIPPGAFLPLAEEEGLLPQIDRWVVSHLLRHLAGIQAATGIPEQAVYFINIAAATLRDQDFAGDVAHQLRTTGLPGSAICFEITNKDLLDNPHDAEHLITALRASGCHIALSGFGRDRVSVALLKSLPLDFVKIDGGLILSMLRDPVAMGKVETINRIAREQGIRTVAELVEDHATEQKLRELNIDYAQGFGISQPRPLKEAQT